MDLAKREKIKGKRKQDLSLSKVLKRHRYLLAISGSTTVYLFSTNQEKSYTWANQYVRQIQNRSYEILPNSSQLSPMVDKILLNLFRSISKDTCLSINSIKVVQKFVNFYYRFLSNNKTFKYTNTILRESNWKFVNKIGLFSSMRWTINLIHPGNFESWNVHFHFYLSRVTEHSAISTLFVLVFIKLIQKTQTRNEIL